MYRQKRLSNKTILISGASGSIGLACAKALLGEGANLILHSFRHPKKIIDLIKKNPKNKIIHLNCDATDEVQVRGQIESLQANYGINHIDVLVNNVGDLIKRCSIDDLEWDFVKKVLDVNVKSAFLFTKYSLSLLKTGATIIFISSSTARYGKGDRSGAYGLSKGAILSWSRCLANELGPRGITVNTITPGFIRGNFHKKYTKITVEREHALRNPLGRVGDPKDVAEAVLFFATLNNGYVSGATLDICGADYMC